MIKIFAVGNSFAEDAHGYLKDLCASVGIELTTTLPFIGGHTFQRHLACIDSGTDDYVLVRDGVNTGVHTTFMDALRSEQWDIVTFNQGSVQSGRPFTYFPHLPQMVDVVRRSCPQAKLYIYETWANERDSAHPYFPDYHCNQAEMFARVRDAYRLAAKLTGLPLIPAGSVIQYLREKVPAFDYANGGMSLNRDGYHMSLLYGRYAVALTFCGVLFGVDVRTVPFVPKTADETADTAVLAQIREAVAAVLAAPDKTDD